MTETTADDERQTDDETDEAADQTPEIPVAGGLRALAPKPRAD